jgi:transcriptional regulator with XRE-family HTH domain
VTEGIACPPHVHGQPASHGKGYREWGAFGAALKRWREARQLSVRGLAAKAHYGKSHISGLENGRLPRPEVAKHLDDILQAGGELVALAEAERVQQLHIVETGVFNPHYYANLATQLLLGPEGGNDMQRRTFVFGASSIAGLSLTAPALALEAARHGLTLALTEQRADVAVDEWQAVVTEYGYSYQTTPPAWADDRLRFTESFVYSHLGDVRQATIAQEQALAAYPAAYRRGPAQIELQRALCLVRSDDVTGGVKHAQTVMAGLSPAECIRPIFDLSRRVLNAVPIAQQPHHAVIELRDCIAALDASG